MSQCESCGMPLNEDNSSTFDKRYCIYCQDQQTEELKSKEEVREGSVQAMMQYEDKTQEEAEELVDTTMPNLPRWQAAN